MKIGIDIRLIGKKRTGDEVVIFNLVRQFAQMDTDHRFELMTDVTDNNSLEEIGKSLGIATKENFKIISIPCKNRFAWNFWTLPNYLRKNPVDIYHTQYITPWFVPRSTKIVTIIHDISFNFFPKLLKFSDLLFLKTLIPISIKRADKIVGVSEFTKNEIIKYYKTPAEKVEWIHDDISGDFKKEISQTALENARKKYNLPEKFVLYVGTLQPRKNIGHLIEAFARIKDEVSGLKLVICGNQKAHNYDKNIDAALERFPLAGDVIFPGFIDEQDKAAVFHLAHVFAFPSLYEGFGIPVLEAMSQSVPVVCSDIPSLKEVAGDGALYFETGNLDDFAKKLYDISMNESLRSKLIRRGQSRVSLFSWEKSARKMLAIYENLLHN